MATDPPAAADDQPEPRPAGEPGPDSNNAASSDAGSSGAASNEASSADAGAPSAPGTAPSATTPVQPAPTAHVTPLPPRLQAHERLQRGLVHRGAVYVQPSPTGSWRTGPVGLERPADPEGPARFWLLVPATQHELPRVGAVVPEALRDRTALAFAVDALPAAREIAALEARLQVPLVVFSADGVRGGPAAERAGAVREVSGTLAYPEAELSGVDLERAYARLAEEQQSFDFFQLLRRVTPRVWVMPAVLAVCVLVWLLQVMNGVHATSPTPEALLAWGANAGYLSLGREPWRLLTAGFLHYGLVHLALNMWGLYYLGPFAERLFGAPATLALYLASVVAGSIASAGWSPVATVGAGASAGLFGVAGAVLGFVLVQPKTVPPAVRSRLGRAFGGVVLINLGLTFALSFAVGIDNAAHLGGLAAGFLAGALLSRPLPPEPRAERRRLLTIPALVVALALTGVGVAQVPAVRAARVRPALAALEQSLQQAWVLLEQDPGPARTQRARALATRVSALPPPDRVSGESGTEFLDAFSETRAALLGLLEVLEADADHPLNEQMRVARAFDRLALAWYELGGEKPPE